MRTVVFAAPYAMESTLRFLRATAALPDIRFGLITQESPESLQAKVGLDALDGYARIDDALDSDQMERAVRDLAGQLGGRVDVLMGILEPLQEPMAEVRHRLGIEGIDPETARRFRDKAHMKSVLRGAGLPCAAHRLADSVESALDFGQSYLPVIVKPQAGAGAINTLRVDSLDHLRSLVTTVRPSAEAPILLEEFVQGDEFSFDSISVGGQHVFHSICEYAPTPLTVMETPWIQWTVLLPRSLDDERFMRIKSAGPDALTALGMSTGMTHMEWFRRTDGSIAISEVAARPPGAQFTTLMSHAHERDFYSDWAEVSVFGQFEPPERKYATGGAYLRGQGQGNVVAVEGLDELQDELGDLVVEARIPGMGQPKSSSYEGEGYVVLKHPDTEVVADGLRRVVSTLRVRLGQGS